MAGVSFSNVARSYFAVEAATRGRLPLSFEMPCCGYAVTYTDAREIPLENIPCPCGAPDRFVVWWKP